ncbi:phosphatase PAP2 family protein [Blastococcus sp. BMG 814]|uniref:Phosphatase PAP2 family protein n=1 Tax=Blastococcus carthaginiensis TaxID=3050034 RepID=A0ABT9IA25_9ACTN|nr:phosphatase PAP2 family protein [Blastococcus carthaginiensis]MDP5182421.1 phosphatase PAP2 family protein [Blastococcus carthaginiensis]
MTAVDRSAPAPAAAPPVLRDTAPGARGRAVAAVLWAGLLGAFVLACAARGLPTDRVVLLGWVLAGLAVTSVTHGWRRLVHLLVDWLPLVAVLLAYDATRGLADGLGMPVHVREVADADRWFTGGVLPTVWLQEHVRADWWKAVATLVYSSHFVLTPVVLAVLWLRDRARWARCARLVVALSLAGLVTYVLYPAAPPWLAAKQGVIEPVGRISNAGWEVLGLPRAGVLLETGQGQVNLVAAVPSLHTAFAVLMCIVLLPLARYGWQRAGLVAYAVLMPVVLVWSGEHYVVDTLLGAAYACAVVLLAPPAGRLARAGARRAAARPLPWRV